VIDTVNSFIIQKRLKDVSIGRLRIADREVSSFQTHLTTLINLRLKWCMRINIYGSWRLIHKTTNKTDLSKSVCLY